MQKVNMHEAKTNLSKLVRSALEGEDVVIARHGKPMVRLVPFHAPEGLRPVGLHRLSSDEATEEFFDESMRPLSAEDASAWTEELPPHEEPS